MSNPEFPPLSLHGRLRRAGPWALLLALLGVAQTLLVVLAVKYENTRSQDETDTLATETATEMRRDLLSQMQALQVLAFAEAPPPRGAKALPRCCASARACGGWSGAMPKARCWTRWTRLVHPPWCPSCRARTWAWMPIWPAAPPAMPPHRCFRARTSCR
jgi:hypothetical protein